MINNTKFQIRISSIMSIWLKKDVDMVLNTIIAMELIKYCSLENKHCIDHTQSLLYP